MKVLKIVLLVIFISLGYLLSADSETEAERHLRRGNEHYSQGEYEQAIDEYQRVIQINPNYALAYYNLGETYRLKGKLDDAIVFFQKGVEIDPNNLLGLFLLGACYKLQGELDDATSTLLESIRIDPNFIMAHLGLGDIYRRQGKDELAVAKCQLVIDLPPDQTLENFSNAYAHSILADIYRKQGKLDEALAKLRKAIQIEVDPDVAPAWGNYCQGGIYLTQGKLDEALSEFQQVVKVNPKEGYVHYSLVCVYSLKTESKLAIEYLKKTFDLDKSFIEFSKTDPDLDNIRQTPEFQQLINSD